MEGTYIVKDKIRQRAVDDTFFSETADHFEHQIRTNAIGSIAKEDTHVVHFSARCEHYQYFYNNPNKNIKGALLEGKRALNLAASYQGHGRTAVTARCKNLFKLTPIKKAKKILNYLASPVSKSKPTFILCRVSIRW